MNKRFGVADIILAAIVIAVIMLIVVPLAPAILDVLLLINITVSVIILLSTLYINETLDFAAFPTLLLLTTLFRIALNIAAMRNILGNQGQAGSVIETFGNFVIGNNIVVGVIIFLIIVIVQFVVITKGAERVAEVAARFTLDAMPGKQMAIDADLNSGLIDEMGAKERRLKIQREADFYGSMDGASKFVKGDAILGIIITAVNIIGGIVIGLVMDNQPFDTVINTYLLASIGDGLVGQIPALLISTSMGVIVTRAATDGNLGEELKKQLFSNSMVLYVTGALLIFMSFIPGMPAWWLRLLGVVFPFIGYSSTRRQQLLAEAEIEMSVEVQEQEKRKPENVTTLLEVRMMELEFGYALTPLIDVSQGGDLLERIIMIRRQCALELGIIIPHIRVVDNIQLGPGEYVVKIKGSEVARGEVLTDHYLALNATADEGGDIKGIETIEPAFGLPALWISQSEREKAELYGFTIIDPPSVIATHMTEVIKRHASELLSRQQVSQLLENLRRSQPALVDEVVPKLFSLGELQRIMGNLLDESVPIRDLITILETLGNFGVMTRDMDMLTEYVRQALRRTISRRFVPDKRAHVITIDPGLEQLMLERVRQTEQGSYVALDPEHIQSIFKQLKDAIDRMTGLGLTPMVLASPQTRMYFKQLTAQFVPDLIVVSYSELESDIEIYSDGLVRI